MLELFVFLGAVLLLISVKNLDKIVFGFSHEIEVEGVDLALDGGREMGDLGQSYEFNFFCVALVVNRYHFDRWKKPYPSSVDAA